MDYKFIYESKEYILTKENCEGIFFDDENEVTDLSVDLILNTLNEGGNVIFSNEYYADKCSCNSQEKIKKAYRYLEYHFYVYTKNKKYIINTICDKYKDTSFNKLFRLGKIDDSYIVNVTLCPNCGTYSIAVDQCAV